MESLFYISPRKASLRRGIMNEERKEILRLLAEGVVDVDGAEKLLRALDEGERNRSRSERCEGGGRHIRHGFAASGMAGTDVFASIGEALAGIGPAMKEAVSSAMCDIPDVISGAIPDEDMKDIPLTDGSFRVPDGSIVVIRSIGRRKRGGDLSIKGIPGDCCSVECDAEDGVRVVGREGKYVLAWQSGDLDVGICTAVKKLEAFSTGGDIDVDGVSAEVGVKTMGGDLEMTEIGSGFAARTMGGDLMIRLAPDWTGDSEAITMGGDVTVRVPAGLKASIEATTMGGEIDCDSGIGDYKLLSKIPGQRAILQTGGEGGSTLRVKTMGGDIDLKGVRE
jgi:hypothetical protein